MSNTEIGFNFKRIIYSCSDEDEDFEISYDSKSKFLTLSSSPFMSSLDRYNKEVVNLSVNTFKILITLIGSPYYTFETRIDQVDGYAYLFNFFSEFKPNTSFMIRTVNGVNKHQIHIPSHIGVELFANSIRINSEIDDMDQDRSRILYLKSRLNSIPNPNPNSKTYVDDPILQWNIDNDDDGDDDGYDGDDDDGDDDDDEGYDVCNDFPMNSTY